MLYDKDNNMQLCLVATKGDMSKNGISDISSVVLFDNKDKKEVDKFLRLQLEYDLDHFEDTVYNNTYNKYIKAMDVLFDLKIFTHKYEARSTWQMEIFDEDELRMYEPYKVNECKIYRRYKSPNSYEIMKYSKESIKNWLGDRGIYELWSRYKVIKSPSGKAWLFILIDGYVELYNMQHNLLEPYCDWEGPFNWKKDNLVKIIKQQKGV
jgi:hypothetical protein